MPLRLFFCADKVLVFQDDEMFHLPQKHRGRCQAQGPNKGVAIEESVPWAQEEPPTADKGHSMLNQLGAKLSDVERALRDLAFERAHKHVDDLAKAGGKDAVHKASFPMPARRDGRRVDIEILSGKAFVLAETGGNAEHV